MTKKRIVAVRILAAIAFIVLFLLPIIGFMATDTNAVETEEAASMHSGDYVFFIVQNEDVPLAAVPMSDSASPVIWGCLAFLVIVIMSVYSAWYISTRRSIMEISDTLLPSDRRFFSDSRSFFHPIRSYQLAKYAEDSFTSLYIGQF